MDTMVGLKTLEVGTFLSAEKSWAKRTVHGEQTFLLPSLWSFISASLVTRSTSIY